MSVKRVRPDQSSVSQEDLRPFRVDPQGFKRLRRLKRNRVPTTLYAEDHNLAGNFPIGYRPLGDRERVPEAQNEKVRVASVAGVNEWSGLGHFVHRALLDSEGA